MEISRRSCRICLSETDFNTSLFGNYCLKRNMISKILVCVNLVIEKNDPLNTICYKCAESIENYYAFITLVKKSQTKLTKPRQNIENVNRRVTSYVREEVYDADYSFSFHDIPKEEKKDNRPSSPFFSYFSPHNMPVKKPDSDHIWKTPQPRSCEVKQNDLKRHCKSDRTRLSRDLFESQSQDVDEPESRSLNWKLTPDDNILKRVRDKCFRQSNF